MKNVEDKNGEGCRVDVPTCDLTCSPRGRPATRSGIDKSETRVDRIAVLGIMAT
ncbi:MAG: hypothetical protein AABZ47_11495 [Planctomycetota bacterium]